MSAPVLFIFYGSIVFCVVAGIIRMAMYASAPLHLRWELYRKGSIYELSGWWKRPHLGFRRKLGEVILDIALLRQYYQRDRAFWAVLYPFHLGIYLLGLWHVFIFILPFAASAQTASLVTLFWGHLASGFVFAGSLGILVKRLADARLRVYYPKFQYLKWLFIAVTVAGGYYAVYSYFGNSVPDVLSYIEDQFAFNWAKKLNPPLLPALHVLAVSVWLVYLPFSHMMQLFSRYYHELRWDHVPNLRGSAMESRVNQLLRRRLSWSAEHIQPANTWHQAAQRAPRKI